MEWPRDDRSGEKVMQRHRRRAASLVAVMLLSLMGGTIVTPASAVGDQALAPLADTGVYSGSPGTNYGTSTTARVDSSTTADRPWYLKFPAATVPAGESVVSAKLRFYTTALPAGFTKGPAVTV